MKLKSISIEGFRSFASPQELKLEETPPGLYLVAGINELEPALEGNGAGKSSLMEALFWCLFGKTSRNLKAGSIRTWGTKTCKVSLDCEGFTLTRSSSPNELLLNESPIEQEALEKELHLTPEVMLSAVFFAQFSPFFLDLTTTARMEIYSAALGLGLWEVKSDQAKDFTKTAAQEAQQLEVAHARLEEKEKTLRGMDFSADIAAWDAKQKEKLGKAAAELGSVDLELAPLAKKHDTLASSVAKAQRDFEAHQQALKKAAEQVSIARKQEAQVEAEGKAMDQQVSAAAKEYARFLNRGEGACKECGQELGEAHKKKHAKHLQAIWDGLRLQVSAKVLEFTRAQAASKKMDAAHATLLETVPSLPALEAELRLVAQSLAALNKTKFTAALAMGALKKEVNPFHAQREANKQQVEDVRKQAKQKKAELKETRDLQAQFEFWIKGFKDVRYQVMQESLAQLNAETNECLHQLGLEDWSLEFGVEKENKSGTVKRGFLCTVHSPYTEEAMPWEVWSGGESQRLRLAAQLGVSNLLCSRMGLDFDFEFFDEPSSWLSPGGIKELLTVLQERAQRYGRRIFVADHRAFDFTFDGVLTVTKTEEGSILGAVEAQS